VCTKDWLIMIGLGSMAIFLLGCIAMRIWCKPDVKKGWYWPKRTGHYANLNRRLQPPTYVVLLQLLLGLVFMIGILFLGTVSVHQKMLSVCHAI
jgi:hypothetical protein